MKYYLLLYLLFLCELLSAQVHLPCTRFYTDQPVWTYLGPVNDSASSGTQRFGASKSLSVNPSDSNEIFLGSYSSGLFHTIDRGQNWECLTDQFPLAVNGVGDLIIEYDKKPYRITLATGVTANWYDLAHVGILQSEDGGKSWKARIPKGLETFTFDMVKRFALSADSSVWYAYGDKDILRSEDRGQTWDILFSTSLFPDFFYNNDYNIQSLQVLDDAHKILFSTASPEHRNAAGELIREPEVLFWNTKAEKAPEKSGHLFPHPEHRSEYTASRCIKLIPIDQSHRYFIVHRNYNESPIQAYYWLDANKKTVYRKLETEGGLYENTFWMHGIQVNAKNPAIQYYGGTVLYKSTDSGKHFTALYSYGTGLHHEPHPDIRSFCISHSTPDGEGDELYLATDGGISFCSQGGHKIVNISGLNLPITEFHGVGVSPFSSVISAGAQDNSIMSYIPGENRWITDIKGDGYDVEYSETIPGLAYGQYNAYQLSATHNDVAPFMKNTGISHRPRTLNKRSLYTHPNGTVYVTNLDLEILFPGQKPWFLNRTGFEHAILSLGICREDPSVVYASQAWSGLFKSTDSGKHFTDLSSKLKLGEGFYGNTRIHAICVDPADAQRVWIALGYLGDHLNPCKQTPRVLFTENGGESWIDASQGLPVFYLADIRYLEGSDDVLMACSQDGIYIKTGMSAPWLKYGSNFPKVLVSEIIPDYCRNKLIAATFGRGLWEAPLPDIPRKPIRIRKTVTWRAPSGQAIYLNRDLDLGRRGKVILECPVYLSGLKKIRLYKNSQIEYRLLGEFIYGCSEPKIGYLEEKKKRKRKVR